MNIVETTTDRHLFGGAYADLSFGAWRALLGDPVSRCQVAPSGPHLVWTAVYADVVESVFRAYGGMTERDPEAWA